MVNRQPISVQGQVRAQFDRQVAHYLQESPMADRGLLGLIVRMASPAPAHRILDVACGAGFLVCELAKRARWVFGVDLSGRMLAEARKLALALRQNNTAFYQADSELLPFRREAFDLVSCKLAFHYFPRPKVALGEMRRVATRAGRVALIDRVSSEDPDKRLYQNQVEKLRTPAKVRVYSESELVDLMEEVGLKVEQRGTYPETMGVEEWIRATGPDEETAQTIMTKLTREGDPAGLNLEREGDRLVLTHRTCILVACQR